MTITPATDETVTRTVAIARARAKKRRFRPRDTLLGLAGIVLFLLVWEVASRTGAVNAEYLPPPSRVLPHLLQVMTFPDFWAAVGDTMLQWGLGMLIALVLAGILGIIIGLSPFLRRATHSTVEFLRPVPSIALIPLASLLFGSRMESALLLVVYAAFWQIFIQVLYGVADVDQVAMQTGRSYGFTKLQRIRHIVFPTATPYLMTGIRLAAAVSLILAIIAQLFLGPPGLGKEIAFAQNAGRYETMYALAIATGLLGVAINVAVRLVERRALAWHTSVRGELPA